MDNFESFTDIVQIPVIRVRDKLLQPLSEYSKLDPPALYAVAGFYGGTIEYLKVRAEVSPVMDADLCKKKDCYNPRKSCHHAAKTQSVAL